MIALLIASHEMNYKIIGMLFILLHVSLCVCVFVVFVRCTCITYQPTEMRYIAFLQVGMTNTITTTATTTQKLDTICFLISQ